ncbi:MAG: hypothetical protein IJ127_19525 [Afipia sp.]|jgi:hypothetical protein|nr:hypothetical protein [Afipia sp.]MBS4005192.1 hypothetical protein [Afipia sp.]WIG53784.1 MAG: hypothetical protein OJF48_004705 [Afipia sp.]
MAKDYAKLLRKLDRPPSGPNWVRFIHDDPIRTAKAILAFLFGIPPFTYQGAYRAAKDRIEWGISDEAAIQVALAKCSPIGRAHNEALIRAFLRYARERNYATQNPIGFENGAFRISRGVVVPVAPLSIIREHKKFVPIFMCGWSALALTLRQRRLLMTVYEDSFLSLTDYQQSPAEVLFFPRIDASSKERESEVWHRGDYDLLSQRELDESVEIFLLAREIVRNQLTTEAEALRTRAHRDGSSEDGS